MHMKNKYIICKICNEYVCYNDSEVEIISGKKFVKCPYCLNHIEIK